MQPSLGQRNPGLLGSAATTRSNATAGLGSFRACRWILSPSFVLVPVRVGGLFFCHFYFLCVSCSGKKGRESNLTVTVSSIAPPKLCFGHLRAGFLVPWNSSYLDLVELILIYVWIFKASILLLLMTPRPFIRLKTI